MKKAVLFVGAVVFMFALPVSVKVKGLTKKEKFGIELKACQEAFAKGKPSKCRLYGKIQYVTSFPDVKVKVVDSFPDIKVKIVNSFPDKPGLWKIVNSFPDYKVQKVTSFPDYKIKFVTSFPGCN